MDRSSCCDYISYDLFCDENQAMNNYQVTFANGEVVEVEAWTPEIAGVMAEEEADLNGRPLSVVSVELSLLQPSEG
jgi:hypothetical protein